MPTLLLATLSWTTRDRAALIKPAHAAALAGLLPKLAEKGGAEVTELAVVANHVHAVLRLGPACDPGRLVQYMKGGSAVLLDRLLGAHGRVQWADGYELCSTDLASLPRLRRCLDEQGRLHGVPLLVRWSVVKVADELWELGVRRKEKPAIVPRHESRDPSPEWSRVRSIESRVSTQD